MDLRPELVPVPIDDARRGAVRAGILQIEAALDRREEAADLIRTFNTFTGRDYDEHMFRHYWRSVSLDDFVRQAARPKPAPVPDVTRAELAEVVRRAMPGSGDSDYEAYMEIFDANVPAAWASGLIFYPPGYDAATNTWDGGRPISEYDPTPEQIVDLALAGRGGG